MKIIKFGGKSLAQQQGLDQVISIIQQKIQAGESLVTVVSARGATTDLLDNLLEKASLNNNDDSTWQAFVQEQLPQSFINLSKEYKLLEDILSGVRLTGDYTEKTKDLVLAQGEILAAKQLAYSLQKLGIDARFVDSRHFFKTDSTYGNARINETRTEAYIKDYFKGFNGDYIPVVTGFIASDAQDCTTTLGRNGSNYSASLLAKYLQASTVESFTHINGIYTANPDWVDDARTIDRLSFAEAHELAAFGASILHKSTIAPLVEQAIPLRIRNTFRPEFGGTLITNHQTAVGVKSIAVQEKVAFVHIEGKGFLGKKGIDARIFTTLQQLEISVNLIAQGSSENAISFVIDAAAAKKAVKALQLEFALELQLGEAHNIRYDKNIAVLTLIGQNLRHFSTAFKALNDNNIKLLLVNNTVAGKNISLVLPAHQKLKAIRILHAQIFGVATRINIAVVGKGTVGASFLDQLTELIPKYHHQKKQLLNIFALAGTQKVVLNKFGIDASWRNQMLVAADNNKPIETIIDYAQSNYLENLIFIDNTASQQIAAYYPQIIKAGFDLVSSNKIANTQDIENYKQLHQLLRQHGKKYLYETNVGAGLPIINTIKLLHASGENITKIRGVFSGSLSYIFNAFSTRKTAFSTVLQQAEQKGYTEPDARDDLSGKDVARKLLILARELGLKNDLEDVQVESLVPESLKAFSLADFKLNYAQLNHYFEPIHQQLADDKVLRYVAELGGNLQNEKGTLSVSLESVQRNSPIGNLQGSDTLFEIYTSSYGDQPIVIQGAGAGAAVTARGVLGDVLRIAEKK